MEQIQYCVCPATTFSTRTPPALRRLQSILERPLNLRTIQLGLSITLSNEEVRESFQDEAQSQNKRVPLLSTAWLLCRAAKSLSSVELYSIQS